MPISSYRLVVKACHSTKAYDSAARFLEEMRLAGVEVDSSCCSVAVKVYGRLGRFNDLVSLLDQNGVTGSLDTFHEALGAAADAGEWKACEALVARMKKLGHPETTKEAGLLMQSLRVAGYHAKACELFEAKFQDGKGLVPDARVYENMVRSCLRIKQYEKVKELVQRMKKGGFLQEGVILHLTIVALGHLGEWREAVEMVNEVGKGVSSFTYEAVVEACISGSGPREACKLLDDWQDNGLRISDGCYVLILGASGAEGDAFATELLVSMKEKGILISESMYNAAIEAYGKAKRWEQVLRLMEEMKTEGYHMDTKQYHWAVLAASELGHGEEARRFYREMEDQEVVPSQRIDEIMLSLAREEGDYGECLQSWKKLQDRGWGSNWANELILKECLKERRWSDVLMVAQKGFRGFNRRFCIFVVEILKRESREDMIFEFLKAMHQQGEVLGKLRM